MLTSAVLALALGFGGPALQDEQDNGRPTKVVQLGALDGGLPRTMFQVPMERMETPKISPKWGWQFEWCVPVLCKPDGVNPRFYPRFRVFEQQKKDAGDLAEQVGQMCARLWELTVTRLRMDHKLPTNMGIVDIFLCFGGKAGGEQLIDEDKQELTDFNTPRKVNTIYIYAVQTFTDPVEMAREVAHEYGHAILPPVGGFKEPEDWANGYLGERLYLKWFRDLLAAKVLGPQDVMGAEVEELDAWLSRKVDPLVNAAAMRGPDLGILSKPGPKAMDAYIGLVMYAESLLPTPVFARSLKVITAAAAEAYPKAMVEATSEVTSYVCHVPKALVNKPIWIPLGKGKLIGEVGIVKKIGDWAQVKSGTTGFKVENPKPKDGS